MKNPDQWYNLNEIKDSFHEGTEYFLTIGTWGDSSGFEQASRTPELRQTYADNVAKILDDQGFDGVGTYYKSDTNYIGMDMGVGLTRI